MSDRLYIKFGTHYTHEPGELTGITVEGRRMFSRRAARLANLRRLTFTGILRADLDAEDPVTNLKTKMQNLRLGYANDGNFPVKLMYAPDPPITGFDEEITSHSIHGEDSTAITGIHVRYVTFESDKPGRFSPTVKYRISLECLFSAVDPTDGSQTIMTWDSYRYVGNTGGTFRTVNTQNGPISFTVFPSTKQRIIQTGRAIGRQGYVTPVSPLLTGTFELHRESVQEEFIPGMMEWNQQLNYETKWEYHMESFSDLSLL
jgi:hypothetical protein|tara:strand:- start:4623 stop:5402 length:780 start_codon:yes stop_codon:yes gene_type:complete